MSDLHAIFRQTAPDHWEAYSRPVSIHAAGPTWDQARDEFLRAAEFHFDDDWPEVSIVHHIEREAVPGVWVRTALDRYSMQREHVADALRHSLSIDDQLRYTLASALESSTGDIVFVCCVPGDRLSWVSDQLARTDAFQVAARLQGQMYWWMPLAAAASTKATEDSETLLEAGLTGPEATVADLVPIAVEYQSRLGSDDVIVRGSARPLVAAAR